MLECQGYLTGLTLWGFILIDERLFFLVICETWLINDVPSSLVEIPGFVFVRRDVQGTVRKPGVGLYVRIGVEFEPIERDVANLLVVRLSA